MNMTNKSLKVQFADLKVGQYFTDSTGKEWCKVAPSIDGGYNAYNPRLPIVGAKFAADCPVFPIND